MIVVEGADRFGLAALHQLRGRVGRGTRPSSCYLVSSEASERLAILEHSHNGFRIAEADLIHRCAACATPAWASFLSVSWDLRIVSDRPAVVMKKAPVL